MPANTRSAELKSHARELRHAMTDAERHLWQRLRGKQLSGIKFRRQQIIGPYIVDFVSLQHRLVIELDGGQHAEKIAYDEQRTAFLQGRGYRVLRFWNHDVLQQLDSVLECIFDTCTEKTQFDG